MPVQLRTKRTDWQVSSFQFSSFAASGRRLPSDGEACWGRVAAMRWTNEDDPGTSRHRTRLRQETQGLGQEVEWLLRQRSVRTWSQQATFHYFHLLWTCRQG